MKVRKYSTGYRMGGWKTLLPFAILLVCLLVISCEKKFEGIRVPLAVNSTSLDLDSAAGTTHIMVYSTGKWQVAFEGPVSWATLNKSEGSGNSDFVLSYEDCVDTTRSAVIVITRDTMRRQISINQKAKSDYLK